MSFEKVRRGVIVLAAMAVALPALAQQPPEPAAEPVPAAPLPDVEEIIITSTKREANIQDVPIAVSAFSTEDLAARGIDEFEEIEEVSPSIQVNTSNGAGANSTIRVRGVGTTGNNPGLEAAVGVFIDGVYRSRSGQAFSDLLDIERIEVLRGPQGTLFGKNTSAGAISVVTKLPVLDGQEGFVQGELGNFDHKRIAVSHSAGIIEGVLGYRVAASWADRDGYYEDANSDDEWVNRDRYMLRGQLLWTPADAFAARIVGDYGERDESCCPGAMLIEGPTSNRFNGLGVDELAEALGLGRDVIDIPLTSTPAPGAYPFLRKPRSVAEQREVGVNSEPFEDITDWGVQLEMNYDFDFAKATSITSYRKYRSRQGQDIDFTSADILDGSRIRDSYENFSQELRLAGTWSKLDWLVGFYGYTEDIFNGERLQWGTQAGLFLVRNAVPVVGIETALPFGTGYDARWNQDTGGWALFSNNTFRITEDLSFTFGVRYSKERKDAVGILNDGPIASRDGQPTGAVVVGLPVPAGVNDAATGALLPGNGGWCEELTAAGLGAFRTALRGFCDNASWAHEKTEKEVTGTASLGYAITDNVNVYVSYSRGYKAGGFNLDQESVDIVTDSTTGLVTTSPLTTTGIVDESRFKPEFANAYEVGIKGLYLDGMARVNVAGFWTNFEDFQLNTFNGLGFTIDNVGKASTKGVELETTLTPADGFVTTLGVTFADARYDEKSNVTFPITLPNGATDLIVAADELLTNAPQWTGSMGVSYERQLPKTEWLGFIGGNLRYTGKRNTGSNLHPFKKEGDHFFLNMSLGVRSPEQHWEASLWSTNLTDEYENNIIFDGVTQAGTQGTFFNPPRMWGGTVRYNF